MSDIESVVSQVEMTAEIVSAYVEHNSVPMAELPALIASVHEALASLSGERKPEVTEAPLQPKVPIRKSVSADHIVCLEDGRRFKSLKRHLHAEHGLTPDAYRAKWGLPKDYPMVAQAYADARSTLAKTIGLGRKAAPSSALEEAGAPSASGHDHEMHDHDAPAPAADEEVAGDPDRPADRAA